MKTAFIGSLLVSAFGLLAPQLVQAQGTVYLSSLSQTSTGSHFLGSDSWLAAGFITGNNASGYTLDSVELGISDASGDPSGFIVMLYGQGGNLGGVYPGISLGSLNGPLSPVTSGLFSYIPASNITLSPSTAYFLVLSAETPIATGAYDWSTSAFPPSSIGWGALNSVYHSNDGISDWSTTSYSGIAQFAIDATDVPEPSAEMLLGCGGVLLLGFARWKAKMRS